MIDSDRGGREEGAAFLCEYHGLTPERLLQTDVVCQPVVLLESVGICRDGSRGEETGH